MTKVRRDKALQMSQKMAQQITEDIVKSEFLKVRLDAETYRQLIEAADAEQRPVSELARLWLKEKLTERKQKTSSESASIVADQLREFQSVVMETFEGIDSTLRSIESEIKSKPKRKK